MFICNYFKNKNTNNIPVKRENTIKYIEFSVERDFTNNLCLICLDTMNTGDDIILIDCGHKYHKDCLLIWFERKKICPECDFSVE
jgi:hypothetical protein